MPAESVTVNGSESVPKHGELTCGVAVWAAIRPTLCKSLLFEAFHSLRNRQKTHVESRSQVAPESAAPSRYSRGVSHYDCLLCHNGRGHLDQISLCASRKFTDTRETSVEQRRGIAVRRGEYRACKPGQYELPTIQIHKDLLKAREFGKCCDA